MVKHKSDIAIKVSNLSKDFILPHERSNSIKSRLINFRKRGYEVQHALKDISFNVNKGDFIGIVGRNGSGKSTLLKILSGIYEPTKGSVRISGKLTPFIELGVGFNPELSGRDNVFLNGALLGFNRNEMESMYDEIVRFAELERFMDQKLKNYSSGMQVRLAFSIAIRANTDILVLDEVLAVGDENFQRKCFEYFDTIKREKKTIVLVTHDMNITEKYCDRAILINDSKIVLESTPSLVASAYREILRDSAESSLIKKNEKKEENEHKKIVKEGAYIKSVKLVNEKGSQIAMLQPGEKIYVECIVGATESIGPVVVTIRCDKPGGSEILFAVSTKRKGLKLNLGKGEEKKMRWVVEPFLNDGQYVLGASIFSYDLKTTYQETFNQYSFEVRGSKWPHSLLEPSDSIKEVL